MLESGNRVIRVRDKRGKDLAGERNGDDGSVEGNEEAADTTHGERAKQEECTHLFVVSPHSLQDRDATLYNGSVLVAL